MKKESIICIIVVVVVIIGNIITQNYTKQCVSKINYELNSLKEEIEKKPQKKDRILNKVKDIKTKWSKMQECLAYYIEHDELEKVGTELSMLEGQAEGMEYSETFTEIEKCIFILGHIQDKTALTIKNIF